MNGKRHLKLVRSTKQALTLTSRQRAWRLNQPDNKTGKVKATTTKEQKGKSSC